MDVTFFNGINSQGVTSFEQVDENSFIGGGRFTARNIKELFDLLDFEVIKHTKYVWELPQTATLTFASLSDDVLMQSGSRWADCNSWLGMSINSMDLAGHLLEIKHNYLNQPKQESLWILFE